jgi:hypothetical protein
VCQYLYENDDTLSMRTHLWYHFTSPPPPNDSGRHGRKKQIGLMVLLSDELEGRLAVLREDAAQRRKA